MVGDLFEWCHHLQAVVGSRPDQVLDEFSRVLEVDVGYRGREKGRKKDKAHSDTLRSKFTE